MYFGSKGRKKGPHPTGIQMWCWAEEEALDLREGMSIRLMSIRREGVVGRSSFCGQQTARAAVLAEREQLFAAQV